MRFCLVMSIVLLAMPIATMPARGQQSDVAQVEAVSTRPASRNPDLSALYQIQDAFESVAERVLPVVVEINTLETIQRNAPGNVSPWNFFFGQRPDQEEFQRPGLGSGVIVRRDGRTIYVLTNNHVVGDADEIMVNLYDGREFTAEVVGKDPRFDLALISFATGEDIPIATLGDSNNLRVGHWILAVGNPLGFESTVTAGIVSAVHREARGRGNIAGFTDYIQTDAAINRGNSGGALVDLNGEIVGINTWIASNVSGGSIGLGFSIPINIAKDIINDFITEGAIVYGWLGVNLYDIENPRDLIEVAVDLKLADRPGALITNVYRNDPAGKGGLRPGDYIVRINDIEIESQAEASRVIGSQPPDSQVAVGVIRNGREREIDVTLGRRRLEDRVDDENLWPGLVVSTLTETIRERQKLEDDVAGVIVVSVMERSPAARAQFQQGDVVQQIGGRQVRGVDDFYRLINAADGRSVQVELLREEEQASLQLQTF